MIFIGPEDRNVAKCQRMRATILFSGPTNHVAFMSCQQLFYISLQIIIQVLFHEAAIHSSHSCCTALRLFSVTLILYGKYNVAFT